MATRASVDATAGARIACSVARPTAVLAGERRAVGRGIRPRHRRRHPRGRREVNPTPKPRIRPANRHHIPMRRPALAHHVHRARVEHGARTAARHRPPDEVPIVLHGSKRAQPVEDALGEDVGAGAPPDRMSENPRYVRPASVSMTCASVSFMRLSCPWPCGRRHVRLRFGADLLAAEARAEPVHEVVNSRRCGGSPTCRTRASATSSPLQASRDRSVKDRPYGAASSENLSTESCPYCVLSRTPRARQARRHRRLAGTGPSLR